MVKYKLVIREKTKDGGYSAYVPERPGCKAIDDSIQGIRQRIAMDDSIQGIRQRMAETIDFHLQTKKIEHALHRLGKELLEVKL